MTRREELAARWLAPGLAPDGWVIETWVDHVLVDSVTLDIFSDIWVVADKQAALVRGHAWWELLVYDGDTGELTMRMGSDPLDDFSRKLQP